MTIKYLCFTLDLFSVLFISDFRSLFIIKQCNIGVFRKLKKDMSLFIQLVENSQRF